MKSLLKTVTLLSMVMLLNACATKSLLEKDSHYTRVSTTRKTLVQDNVVAFGKPVQKLQNMPNDTIVMVGDKQSYVLMQGGKQLATLLNHLDPSYLRVTSPLKFVSKNNDGQFNGKLVLRYSRLQSDIGKQDIQFFLQNNVRECTNDSDKRMNAQSFCFDIELEGGIYPPVSNRGSLKALSKPYPIEIYTETKETKQEYHDKVAAQKVVLFPFAVAFDVVTLPFQIISKIFE